MDQSKKKKTGPKPKTINAEGVDWKDALKHTLNKPKPKDGWPKDDKKDQDGGEK